MKLNYMINGKIIYLLKKNLNLICNYNIVRYLYLLFLEK